MKPAILALWSAPRSRSTVFYRAMLERGDLLALHEPFCNIADYGETEVTGEVVRSEQGLIEAMRAAGRPVFFKDTTDHHYAGVLADPEFLTGVRHTFLIRRPDEIVASFAALKPDMTVEEAGLEFLYEIFSAVRDATGTVPLVVDSDDLIADPAGVMRAYCAEVGLPFLENALSWQPTDRTEWSRSARWHQGVRDSTTIERRESRYDRTVATDPQLAAFAAHHEPFYRKLHEHRLRPHATA
jgi:sulfotransferase family protein